MAGFHLHPVVAGVAFDQKVSATLKSHLANLPERRATMRKQVAPNAPWVKSRQGLTNGDFRVVLPRQHRTSKFRSSQHTSLANEEQGSSLEWLNARGRDQVAPGFVHACKLRLEGICIPVSLRRVRSGAFPLDRSATY